MNFNNIQHCNVYVISYIVANAYASVYSITMISTVTLVAVDSVKQII